MKLASAARNFFPTAILRSPFHRLLSRDFLLLRWTGKKTGKRYTTPVAYLQRGPEVLVSTDDRWWKNFAGGAQVTMRIRGRDFTGLAEPEMDEEAGVAALQALIDAQPAYPAKAGMSLPAGRSPTREDLLDEIRRGRVIVRVRVTPVRSGA